MHVWWYGESKKKKGGEHTQQGKHQANNNSSMDSWVWVTTSQVWPKPQNKRRITDKGWVVVVVGRGAGGMIGLPILGEVSLGKMNGAGPLSLRFTNYDTGVIQVWPNRYFNKERAIESFSQGTVVRLTINHPALRVSDNNAMRKFLLDTKKRLALRQAGHCWQLILLSNSH